ncbi:hypothetical protein NDN08_005755 [Rhodosorus marinus]|uniref:Uncharacterized protein n=1 Tax=Rhodosorus marinus TaxID=101924 RepID=A0AAV8V4A4_9RHOD|nr:hypothetical protein NDN08_005755 [Rhodosorus marinus]
MFALAICLNGVNADWNELRDLEIEQTEHLALNDRAALRRLSACKPRIIDVIGNEYGSREVADELLSANASTRRWVVESQTESQTVFSEWFDGVQILGGVLTVIKRDGAVVSIFGKAHTHCDFDVLPPVVKSRDDCETGARLGRSLDMKPGSNSFSYETRIFIDPLQQRPICIVHERALAHWHTYWIDAALTGTGSILGVHNNLNFASGVGFGVCHEERDLSGLTSFFSPLFYMYADDNRQITWDARYSGGTLQIATDSDDIWDSKKQAEVVDAQYWMKKVDEYLLSQFKFDFMQHYGAMEGVVRLFKDFQDAFWDGLVFGFGSGDDGKTIRPLSSDGGIVAHEIGHAVGFELVELIPRHESGAIIEAFSDIFAASFLFELIGDYNWIYGEKAFFEAGGLRSMKDPGAFGHPSHFEDYDRSQGDNGGVHKNNGIVNHWFYLLSEGGTNANARRRTGSTVKGIGIEKAMAIIWKAYGSLPVDADFCDLRIASSSVAQGMSLLDHVIDAWEEVGISETACGSRVTPSPTPVPSEPPGEDGCRGLCPPGMACVGLGRRGRWFYCLRCNGFRTDNTSDSQECCMLDPTRNRCKSNTALARSERCRAEKGVFLAAGDNPIRGLGPDDFIRATGLICHIRNNFKLHGDMCRIRNVRGQWTCDFGNAREEALSRFEKK